MLRTPRANLAGCPLTDADSSPPVQIGVYPSLREYACKLEQALEHAQIVHHEVVQFKGKTVRVDCQPWLPQGQGLVGGREVSLHVPRGAITAPVRFTISICNAPGGSDEYVQAKITTGRDKFEHGRLVGVVVDIQPHGIVFERPAGLTIPHACFKEDEEDEWDGIVEMLTMQDFFTVKKLPTMVFKTLQGGAVDSLNVTLPIRETGIFAIKGSHACRDRMDITVVTGDINAAVAIADMGDPIFRREKHPDDAPRAPRASISMMATAMFTPSSVPGSQSATMQGRLTKKQSVGAMLNTKSTVSRKTPKAPVGARTLPWSPAKPATVLMQRSPSSGTGFGIPAQPPNGKGAQSPGVREGKSIRDVTLSSSNSTRLVSEQHSVGRPSRMRSSFASQSWIRPSS